MPLISDALMTKLQALDESAMPSMCQLLRRTTPGQNPTSGLVDAANYTSVGAPFGCRDLTGGSVDALIGEQVRGSAIGVVAVPLGTVIDADDRIDVTTTKNGVATTKRYSVVGPDIKPD